MSGAIGTFNGKGNTTKQSLKHVAELNLAIGTYASRCPQNESKQEEFDKWLTIENSRLSGKRKTNKLIRPTLELPSHLSILGIDPASNKDVAYSAWTLNLDTLDEATLLGFGSVDINHNAKEITQLFQRQTMTHPWLVVIEGQFLGRNAKTFMRLVNARGLITGIAIAEGHVVYDLSPSVWQSSLQITGKSDERKRRSMHLAKTNYVSPILHDSITEDQADAICIGAWMWHQIRFYNDNAIWQN